MPILLNAVRDPEKNLCATEGASCTPLRRSNIATGVLLRLGQAELPDAIVIAEWFWELLP
jgi:hypothetical protein